MFCRYSRIERRSLAFVISIPSTAHLFATTCAEREGLIAENLGQFLDKIVEYSDGNPGAMLKMIHLAKDPKYSHGNQIKITPALHRLQDRDGKPMTRDSAGS